MLPGKKGGIGDLIDFLFTFIAAFFLFFFVSGAFAYTIEASKTKTLDRIAEFNQMDAALRNLQIAVQEGQPLRVEEIDQKISESKVLGGRTITMCADYFAPEDCNKDSVGLYEQSGDSCNWDEEKHYCVFIPVLVAES